MDKRKKGIFKRGLSVLLALMMVLSIGTVGVFASTTGGKTVTQLQAPAEDGLYYAEINLKNANSSGQNSMGNSALRGSSDFETKQPGDTAYSSMVVVENGKATALVEFMPMGFIGMYGMLAELNSLAVSNLTQFGYPDTNTTIETPVTVLSYHKTKDGLTVYDPFNKPDSSSLDAELSDKPYGHLMAVDVTPILIEGNEAPAAASDYTIDNAAYVSVYVPVMGSLGAGYQQARLQVDWTSLTPVENPENNLSYQLYLAKKVQQGNHTDSTWNALQNVISETETAINNIWLSQDLTLSGTGNNPQPVLNMEYPDEAQQQEMAAALSEAVSNLEERGDKTALNTLITEGEKKVQEDYTPDTWAAFAQALAAAKTVQSNADAGISEISAAVNMLETAMNALAARADTTALVALIAAAQATVNTGYSESSWNALQTAITNAQAVADNENATQEDVQAQLTALQSALDSLTTGSLDKNNLPDGTYSVYGEMIKMNRQESSMSNDAINHYIKLTVENGQYYLNMDFHGLSYLNRFGYLAELSYYENGYVFGEYGTISGTRTPAQVLSTQKNADGSDVIDEFNQAGGSSEGLLYPDRVKFPLVTDALADPDGYVPLHVFVPVMEDISAGTGEQDVLLKLDWSTLKATTDNDPNFSTEGTQSQTPAVDLTDAATGITVHADAGTFPQGARLVVEPITSGADYDKASAALLDTGKKFKLYNIHVVDAQGNEIQPNGAVTTSYPIPAGYNASRLAVYRMNEDGTKTLIKGTVENGVYSVMQKSFSQYALVETGSTITDAQNTANFPQTGDNTILGVLIFMALASAGAVAVTLLTKKRRAK